MMVAHIRQSGIHFPQPLSTSGFRQRTTLCMKTTNVYLNSHFEVIDAVRSAAGPEEDFAFICSYRRDKFQPEGRPKSITTTALGEVRTLPHATFIREPARLPSPAYARYCLEVARLYRAEVFLPGRQVSGIAAHAETFRDHGVHVVAPAAPAVLNVINHKGRFYDSVRHCGVPLPAFEQVGTLAEFEAAVQSIGRHHAVCYKPAVSIFGYGFHILVAHPSSDHPSAEQCSAPDLRLDISLPEALAKFRGMRRFKTQLVMQHLPGLERSVDCLGANGRLLCGIVRRKNPDGTQFLEHNETVLGYVRTLVAHFGLSGLFNVQFKDDAAGMPRLLEINPRMAGGISYSFLSGVVLPYWAIRLALGTAEPGDIPAPKTGLLVTDIRKPRLVRSVA